MVGDAVVSVDDSAAGTEGPSGDEVPEAEAESDEEIADGVSVPELMTDGEDAGVEVDVVADETALEEDEGEVLAPAPAPAPPVTLVPSAILLLTYL